MICEISPKVNLRPDAEMRRAQCQDKGAKAPTTCHLKGRNSCLVTRMHFSTPIGKKWRLVFTPPVRGSLKRETFGLASTPLDSRGVSGQSSQRGTMESFTQGCVPTKIYPALQQARLIPLGAANTLGLGDTTAPVRLPLPATAKRPVRKKSACPPSTQMSYDDPKVLPRVE